MQTQRHGSDLKIHLRLALRSLGRDATMKQMSIAEMKALLSELRREQIARGIIKKGEDNK